MSKIYETYGVRENLQQSGYAPVPIDLKRSDLNEAMGKYLEFLKLGEEFQDTTRFLLSGRGDGDFGQYRRIAGSDSERGEVPDNKDIFHFGAQSRQVIEARLRGNIPVEMAEFLDVAEYIFWVAQKCKNQALSELDHWNMGIIDLMSPELAPLNDVLRFIAYYKNNGVLAKLHTDRDVCTLALGESHEGLYIAPGQNGLYLDCDEAYMREVESLLLPAAYVEHEAKFFLGAGWNRLPQQYRLGNEKLPLGYHYVNENGEQVDEELMRWALVMFCNPFFGFEDYTVPTPPETRPYKQLGRLSTDSLVTA